MFELNINGVSYQFNFGIGFVRDINKTVQKPVDGIQGMKEDMGLAFHVGQVLAGDVLALVEVLELANKGKDPRITAQVLEEYIDDPNTDIDKLFADVIDFFTTANATKKTTLAMAEALGIELKPKKK